MPELPEIETLRKDMLKKVKGKKIEKVEVENAKTIKIPSSPEFQKRLAGKTLNDIGRRGKFLIVYLDSTELLIFHLKLTGRLLFFSEKPERNPDYTRISFTFTDGSILFFADMRKFADVFLVSRNELDKVGAIKDMGPEPLSSDFSCESFKRVLRGKRGKIKPALMDQAVLAGVGNIYSQEALYRAGIHPERKVHKLSVKDMENLYEGLVEVLEEALKYRGSSVDAYVDLDGKKGNFIPRLKVYGREGEKCFRCGNTIKKKKVGGRGTYFCIYCQK